MFSAAELFLHVVYYFWEIFLFRCWNHILCHNASMIASHVYHVVCFCVFSEFQVFPVDQDVAQLLLYTFGRSV